MLPAITAGPDQFRDACSRLPSAVCVVTGADHEGPYGATASSVCSLSLDPLLLLVCLDNRSRTLARLLSRGVFAINALPERDAPLAARFASRTSGTEKFAGVEHLFVHDVPVLGNALAWFTCEVHRTHDGGDHTIVVGAVTAVHHDDGQPLVWHDRRYRSLA
ncbi:flavin reductase family protein [Lentzea sp. HUAS TT2]|uniref:flavin reductase family protein n=1 Tax=Lentzea sp. HUAS TT2 TaxID=3447454 RepID=UPI003F70EB94